MKSLAEFAMKGRKQAIIAVLLIGLVPLINFLNPFIVGLVLLRKGVQEAALVFIWAILPVGAWAIAGDIYPLIMLIGVSGLAWLLRETESWEFTLLAAIAVGVTVEIYWRMQPELLEFIVAQIEQVWSTSSLTEIQLDDFQELVPSYIGVIYMLVAIALLMLARWMQAALYNPGGFQKEFHGFRIELKIALPLLGLMLLANFGILMPSAWALYLAVPLMISGLALIHAVVKKKKLSTMWLTVFYVVLLPFVMQLVVLLALIDSWYDFRTRLQKTV